MLLYDICKQLNINTNIEDFKVNNINHNSKLVCQNDVFVCFKGGNFDGHKYAKDAVLKGAKAVICEYDIGLKEQIIVENSRLTYAKICAYKHSNPEKNLKFIGVTGTNGKTTTTSVIKNVLKNNGFKVGLIGTIQNEIDNKIIHTNKTTPEANDLFELLAVMVNEKVDYVVMEVSSQGLDQYRLGDIKFDIGIFTNLTQDHLDVHKDMESYYKAKKMLFDISKNAIINVDDSYGKRLYDEITCKKLAYSIKNKTDFYADNIIFNSENVVYNVNYNDKKTEIKFPMSGLFSVYNSLAAFACCINLEIDINKIVEAIANVGVCGRMEVIPTGKDFTVICDYAHSPDGLENILKSINEFKKGRLVTLFGCGGDRDPLKRPIMGEIASRYSDYLIVTSDNPRSEDPQSIIDDVMVGVLKNNINYSMICDRKEAISFALKNAQPNDIIVLAGKGHETYQILKDKTIDFDEREIVKKALDSI